ncbi:MAG: hypothetical protein IPL50_14615 [Chitinophagaceae bacterium]|nr:hypothetical protein [Chitinophagaceae bacterium]
MNRKITPDHPQYSSLKAYYNFDEPTQFKTYDNKHAITGQYINGPAVVISGAGIGDASAHDFINATKSAILTLPTGENFRATASSGNPQGISVYMVKDPPVTITGTLGVGSNEHYYGVHLSAGSNPQYTAVYDYTGDTLVTQIIEAGLLLFSRTDNSYYNWNNSGAILNVNNNTLTVSGQNTEYILGSSGFPLPVTLLDLKAQKINATTAALNWQTKTEINNRGFEVQRSFDGSNFQS